ncbi:transposase [Candidatus Enterovibrio escicola]|uniref:transposase n=1 Tax=Candidatus Enterovibrio escicola TaxID=1927127 RepID=UPI001237AF07|nr:transposase [Candidatus Enterovibrio escacola]
MSKSKKKEKELQYQRAKARARIRIINELKEAELTIEDGSLIRPQPVIKAVSIGHTKKLSLLTIGLHSYRKRSCTERAIRTKDSQCKYYGYQQKCLLQRKLAFRHDNPLLLTLEHGSMSAIGVASGITRFIALSYGTPVKPLNTYLSHSDRPSKEQSKLAKKVKFSANGRKQTAEIQTLHSGIANCRKDFLHKASNQISKNHAMNAERYSRNVRSKSGLKKSILDQGWYEYRR